MGRGLTVESWRDAAIDVMVQAVAVYGERVAALAVDMFDETMALSGADVHGSMPVGIWTRDEFERIARYQALKFTHDDVDGFIDQITFAAGNAVYQTNMRTMLYQAGVGMTGVELDVRETGESAYVTGAAPHSEYEIRYQRIPQGLETCDFCLMLASRGAVYLSKESAYGHSSSDPNHTHKGCDCEIQACLCHREGDLLVQDTTYEGYDTREMYELWGEWKQVTAKYSGEKGKSLRTEGYRERMAEEKLDLMERRFGRREW